MSKLLYPHTRHYQRYEYAIKKGYTVGKTVADIGSGLLRGSAMLLKDSPIVYAVDPMLKKVFDEKLSLALYRDQTTLESSLEMLAQDVYTFDKKVDVCLAIEVIEHMTYPLAFLAKLAEIAPYAFITTPLAKKTGPTDNDEHVAEYAAKYFDYLLQTRFTIVDKVYQHASLDIAKTAKPRGSSMTEDHVVQMAWCRRK